MGRRVVKTRETRETNITLTLDLDGTGKSYIRSGIGFLDHMLENFAKHGLFDLEVSAKGDLAVDGHHTVEDLGIVLGSAIREAIGDERGMRRYGFFVLPMDDACALCAIDLCGRPYLDYRCEFPSRRLGELDTELIREFFYAVSYQAGMNLHIRLLAGHNSHHMAEAIFKAFAKALDMATSIDERVSGIPSTKGLLS